MEITLLKVEHERRENAQLLLPYIQSCTLFGEERACQSVEDAISHEDTWNTLTLTIPNRTRLKLLIEALKRECPDTNSIWEFDEYLMGCLWRAQRKVLSIERFDLPQSQQLRRIAQGFTYLSSITFEALNTGGNFAKLTADSRACFAQLLSLTTKRDQHIAGNIEGIEHLIQERFPLEDPDLLRYTIFLGNIHSPELYTERGIRVVELHNEDEKHTALKSAHVRLFRRICEAPSLLGDLTTEIIRHMIIDLMRGERFDNNILMQVSSYLQTLRLGEIETLVKRASPERPLVNILYEEVRV